MINQLQCSFRKGTFGPPKSAKLTIDSTRISVTNKNGKELFSVAPSEIESYKISAGSIIYYQGGKVIATTLFMPYSFVLMGLLGMLLAKLFADGDSKAQQVAGVLESLGIKKVN